MNELEMWKLLAAFMSGNAVWFLGYIVAIWLGFRISNNIYETGHVPTLARVVASVYCLSVAAFMAALMFQINNLMQNFATGFTAISSTQLISAAAENFIANSNVPIFKVIQTGFVASIIVMQLSGIWMKKPS